MQNLNGAGNPSWVPRAHPSFPFSCLSGFIDSLGTARGAVLFLCAPYQEKMLPAKKIVQDVKAKSRGDVMGISGRKDKMNKKRRKKM